MVRLVGGASLEARFILKIVGGWRQMSKSPVAFIILDGFGLRDEMSEMRLHRQISRIMICYWNEFPHATLTACGEAVGFQKGRWGTQK